MPNYLHITQSDDADVRDVELVLRRMHRQRFHNPGRGDHENTPVQCQICLELAWNTVLEIRRQMVTRGLLDFAAFATTTVVRGRMLDAERKIRTQQGRVARADQVAKAKCTQRALTNAAESGMLPCGVALAQTIFERVIQYVQYGNDLPESGWDLPYGRIGRGLPGTKQDASAALVAHWWAKIRLALEADRGASDLLARHVDAHTETQIRLANQVAGGGHTEDIEAGAFIGGAWPAVDPERDALEEAKEQAAREAQKGLELEDVLRDAIDRQFGMGVATRIAEADPEAWAELMADVRFMSGQA